MAIRPPRQRTTFKKDKKTGKVKGTTTYRAPQQEKADEQLDRYIRQNQDKKNQRAGVESILQDMPEKRANFVRRNTRKDGTLNSAALAMLNPYRDERPEYSRQLNRLRTSSPEMMQAYARRFPVENFAMETGPRFIPGIGGLFTADQGMKANAEKKRIMNTAVNRPDGGFKNFVDFFAQGMTPDQAKNTEIISGESIRLAPQDIFNKSQPMTEKQKMDFMPGGPEIDIFDPEKAATGDITYNPEAPYQDKIDFINEVYGTNFTADRSKSGNLSEDQANRLFENAKQEQGNEIADSIAGQFNLAGPTVDEGIILGGADSDYQDVPYRTDGIPVEAFKGALLPGDPRDPAPYGFEYKLPEATSFGGRSMDPNFDSYPYTIPVEPVTISDLEDDKSLPFDVTELSQKQLDFLNSPKTQDDLKRGTLSPRQVFDKLPFYEEKTPFNIFKGDQEPTTPQEFNEYLDTIDENKYLRRIATVADGGSIDNYGNMSTHEKLMRMASKMYG